MFLRLKISGFVLMMALTVFAGASQHKDKVLYLSADVLKRYQIELAAAGAETLEVTSEILGKIVPNANKTIYIYPRYGGIVKKMTKYLGDKVRQGELLASVESNQTLQTYEINAPFSGYIVKKEVNPGEFVKTGNPIYQLADLSRVWVHLFVYREQASLIKKGQSVIIYDKSKLDKSATTRIDYVSPLGVEHNQTMKARAVLSNDPEKLNWLPGLYVNARVVIETKRVAVAVKHDAIQRMEGEPLVFVKTNKGFKAQRVQLGLEGESYTEVVSGLKVGDIYVSKNSFILKAELEKVSASHHH